MFRCWYIATIISQNVKAFLRSASYHLLSHSGDARRSTPAVAQRPCTPWDRITLASVTHNCAQQSGDGVSWSCCARCIVAFFRGDPLPKGYVGLREGKRSKKYAGGTAVSMDIARYHPIILRHSLQSGVNWPLWLLWRCCASLNTLRCTASFGWRPVLRYPYSFKKIPSSCTILNTLRYLDNAKLLH